MHRGMVHGRMVHGDGAMRMVHGEWCMGGWCMKDGA